MRWWETQVGGTTRGRLIALLRRDFRTVEELSAELDVTDNAIRAQLQVLEAAGIVTTAGTRQGTGAGKPATLYRIAPSAEADLSAAYAPVLRGLLETLSTRMKPTALDDVLRETGRQLAASHSASRASLETRVHSVAEMLTALGGELDVEKTDDGFSLVGYACPLSAAVGVVPNTCHLIEELVSTVARAPVREWCERNDGLRCHFDIFAHNKAT